MQRLPIGIQDFATLRNAGYLYVDKTARIRQMAEEYTPFFLSRPRRFGKSLLVSALNALFRGKRELFTGLDIEDKWDWSKVHPVIRIDWSAMICSTAEEYAIAVRAMLLNVAKEYGVELADAPEEVLFPELMMRLHQKTGEQVVVLIDEYDKPLLNAAPDEARYADVKRFLHDFYGVLKPAGEYLRFLFLTGVSKFSGVSIFSALNNLKDITLEAKFADICGITQEELESQFADCIDAAAGRFDMPREQLLKWVKDWYNGYPWDGRVSVYNPFSMLNFFSDPRFAPYWYNTGTPTFLLDVLKKRSQDELPVAPVVAQNPTAGGDTPDTISVASLFFQTGYLTIKQYRFDADLGSGEYVLDYPNREVREALLTTVQQLYTNCPEDRAQMLARGLRESLLAGDAEGLKEGLRALVAGVSYPLHIPGEAYYHSLMLVWLRLLGFEAVGEFPTSRGRIDMAWKLPGRVFVAEIKHGAEGGDPQKLLEAALAQIAKKGYAARFKGEGLRVTALAVAFAGREPFCRLEDI
jgi:hypothetical protein